MSVKNPYNFVPAPEEKEVYIPNWSPLVSHDIPFSDGERGEVDLEIKAETPIFIRDGHSESEETSEFFQVLINDKIQYAIPATSLKGMTRNVVEMMSRSRMKLVNDHRYSFRDLSNNSLYLKHYKSADVRCGWLFETAEGEWKIEDCGVPNAIRHEDIDHFFETKFGKSPRFRETFDRAVNHRINKHFKSGIKKYLALKKITNDFFNDIDFDGLTGTLVFTGQPGQRNHQREQGKNGEFIFPKTIQQKIEVSPEKQLEFLFTYLDHDENNISVEWKYWRKKLREQKKIPIFLTTTEGGNLLHFGLAFMYKLPYKKSIKETAPYKSYSFEKLDLAETIFGTVDGSDGPLKGRVFFTNAFADMQTAIRSDKEYRRILSNPKASYFPFYLQQSNPVQRYNTYMDSNAKLRGFKRYPPQSSFDRRTTTSENIENGKVFSSIRPLEAGVIFKGKIRFHNLRPVEIGALLSALTLHGSKRSSHALGGAKPYGFGKVKINATLNKAEMAMSQEEYLAIFESEMGGESWLASEAMSELAAVTQASDESLEYPKGPKLFSDYKQEDPKKHLLPYSEIVGGNSFKKFNGIKQRLETMENGLGDLDVKNLSVLKKQLNKMGFGFLPEELHEELKEVIIKVCENHKPSKNKLVNKAFESYEWETTISTWIGEANARVFYDELKQYFPPKNPPQ